jgi:hypothetical protein
MRKAQTKVVAIFTSASINEEHADARQGSDGGNEAIASLAEY